MLRNNLTGKQKAFLRSQGQTIEPVVFIGKEAVSPTVVKAAAEALKKRELIKVRVLNNCLEDTEAAVTMLSERCDANLVQVIGNNALLFKRNFDKPRIELP